MFRATLLSAAVMVASAPSPALAQDGKVAATDFFTAMNNRIVARDSATTIPLSQAPQNAGAVEAGYYRLVMARVGSPLAQVPVKGCREALRGFTDQRAFDAIFNRRYDVGLSVKLPLELRTDSTDPNSTAEINVFRLTQVGGKRCTVELSYFDSQGDYRTPWAPIDQRQVALPQQAKLVFRPWASRENNKARVDAFWTGISQFVHLLGPVGTISSALFGGGNDNYELRGQFQPSLLGFTNDISTADQIPTASRTLVITPAGTTGTFRPEAIDIRWNLQGGGEEPFQYDLHFTITPEYWASRFFPRASNLTFPNLAGKDRAYYQALVGQLSEMGKPWRELTEPIANLSAQRNPESFQAACSPALTELGRLGFSREDTALLVYSLARAALTEQQTGSIACIVGVTESLRRFSLELQQTLPATQRADWNKVFDASLKSFITPGNAGAASNLTAYLAPQVMLSGNLALLTDGAGARVIPQDGPASISRADLLTALARMRPAVAGCQSPRDSATQLPVKFGLPEFSGLPSDDRAIAHLVRTASGKVFIVAWGIGGVGADGLPVIQSLWVGDEIPQTDEAFRAVVTDMQNNTGSCTTRPDFKAFLDGLSQSTASGVVDGGN